jgi:hypothetical protein
MKSKEHNVDIERMLSASGREALARFQALDKSSAASYGRLLSDHQREIASVSVVSYQLKGLFTYQDNNALRQVMRAPQYAIRSHKSYKGREQARMEVIYNIETYGWDVEHRGNAELLVVDSLPHGYLRVFGAQVREGKVAVNAQVQEFSEIEWLRDPDLIPGVMQQLYERAIVPSDHGRITG